MERLGQCAHRIRQGERVAGSSGRERSTPALVAWEREHPEPRVSVSDVADHVEHIAWIAGRDHVGLGADYDGISGTGPEGTKGVDSYPLLFAELARCGWTDRDLAKLAQGNILRVIERAEAAADERRIGGLGFENLTFGTDGTVYGSLEASRIIGFEVERRF